ncbi:putative Adenylate kinase isoenzyme 1 [Hypsibius exemplaris]|uniref:Adenylate kinase isoenzyme 1 n=1 Tax=Hypsibius exemplaris TaxID=2072580 RepID=A0A1W0WPY2_HYPEX|nr:putative Adenylate kinase isoenzyme 1 [Hypsibius exemplaris]
MAFSETEDLKPKNVDLQPLRNMRQPVIFVVGGPGTGKATQCKKLAEEFNFHHLSMGQAIKDRFKKAQTPQANVLQALSDNGGIISLDEVMEILELEMLRLLGREAKPFIVHGFPRYIFQAIQYERDIGFPRTVILLDADSRVMRERLKERGNKGSRRADDKAAPIEERLNQHDSTIQEVIDYYEPHNKLYVVNANNSVDQVYKDMAQLVELWA